MQPTVRKKTATTSTSPGKVPVTTSLSHSINARAEKYVEEKGLDKVQNLIRLALAKFLDSEGY